jgi:hypothetical protein
MKHGPWTLCAVGLFAACSGEGPGDRPATVPPPPSAIRSSSLPAADDVGFHVLVALDRTGDRAQPVTMSPVRQAISDSRVLFTLADALNARIAMRKDVRIIMKRCGEQNAFYDPADSSITFCDEFVLRLEELFSPLKDDEDFTKAVVYASGFTLLHEAGHALVDQLELPITGAEEDAVDQFATFLLASDPAQAEMAMAGAAAFGAMYAGRDPAEPTIYWDEHSLPEQRFVDINCLIYGSDPQLHSWIVEQGVVPRSRAVRCPAEWARVQYSFATLLAPHLKPER